MAAISNVQQIVASIRAEMAQRAGPGAAGAPSQRRARAKPAAPAQTRSLISQRVQALDPADPQRGRKAFRIFLESVLLSELGDELINDNAFYQMVDQVHLTMEQDPAIAAAIDKAVASLLAMPPA